MKAENKTSTNTESVDDYVKAILDLTGPEGSRVTSNALAERLGVRAASITGMLQKLAARKPPFVNYAKHRGVLLTEAGKHRALEVVRHHRLLERFLHDVLDFPWDEVHAEAERLEHFISERLEDRIAAKLGDPDTDPHGHPIPERNGIAKVRGESRYSRGLAAFLPLSTVSRIEIPRLCVSWSGWDYCPEYLSWSNQVTAMRH